MQRKIDNELISLVSGRVVGPSQQSSVEFDSYIEGISNENLIGPLLSRCRDDLSDAVEYLRCLFIIFRPNTERGREMRGEIFLKVLELLIHNEVKEKKAENIVQFLYGELNTLDIDVIVGMVEQIINSLATYERNDGKFWDFFPHMLNTIEQEPSITIGETTKEGVKLKSETLDQLLSVSWPSNNLISISKALREVNLNNREFIVVIKKLCRQLNKVEISEIPTFIYQLLLFSARGEKLYVLQKIIDHFKLVDDDYRRKLKSGDIQPEKETLLRHSQGTSFEYIEFSVKQDKSFGQLLLRYVQKEKPVFSGFLVSLMLRFARIPSFEEKVMEILRVSVVQSFREEIRRSRSLWYSKVSSMGDRSNRAKEIETALLETIQNSKFGWDQVLQSLVVFGFVLVDEFSVKRPGAIGDDAISMVFSYTMNNKNEQYRTAALGTSLLAEVFQQHPFVRKEILEKTFNRIITNANSSLFCVQLLQEIILSNVDVISEELITRVKEIFDYISFLSPDVSHKILLAIEPLLRSNRAFQDHIVLVMRKAMFNREINSRLIAADGFLLLLESLSPSSSSSSTSTSDLLKIDFDDRSNSDRFEILGFLKRCLTQQASIREKLYSGLSRLFELNPSLRHFIFDILLTHFQRFYDAPNFKLKISECVEKPSLSDTTSTSPKLVEPIAHLLNCIQKCLSIQIITNSKIIATDDKKKNPKNNNNNQTKKSSIMIKNKDMIGDDDYVFEENESGAISTVSSYDQLIEYFNMMVAHMHNETDDFSFDASSDFSPITSAGQTNLLIASLLLEVYQVLIQYLLKTKGKGLKLNVSDSVLILFEKYHGLHQLLHDAKQRNKATKGKKAGSASSSSDTKVKHNMFDIDGVFELTKCTLEKQSGNNDILDDLRNNADFLQFSVAVTHSFLSSVSKLHSGGQLISTNEVQTTKMIELMKELQYFHFFEFCSNWENSSFQKRNYVYLALENMEMELTFLSSNLSTQHIADYFTTTIFISNDDDDASEDSLNLNPSAEKVQMIIHKPMEMLFLIYEKLYEKKKFKETEILLRIISNVASDHLTSESLFAQCRQWVEANILFQFDIENPSTIKLILPFYFFLNRHSVSLKYMYYFCRDLRIYYGGSQELTEKDMKFKCINNKTSPVVFSAVLQHFSSLLDEIEWSILYISKQRNEAFEEMVFMRLLSLTKVFSDLSCCKLVIEQCDALLKESIKLYKILKDTTKRLISNAIPPPPIYQNIVEESGKNLTPAIYEILNGENVVLEELKKKQGRKKELTLKPNLIFEIERYEVLLIDYSKKFKVELMKGWKRSQVRDFRFTRDIVKKALQNLEPPTKKIKLEKVENDDSNNNNNNNNNNTKNNNNNNNNITTKKKAPRQKSTEVKPTVTRKPAAPKNPKTKK